MSRRACVFWWAVVLTAVLAPYALSLREAPAGKRAIEPPLEGPGWIERRPEYPRWRLHLAVAFVGVTAVGIVVWIGTGASRRPLFRPPPPDIAARSLVAFALYITLRFLPRLPLLQDYGSVVWRAVPPLVLLWAIRGRRRHAIESAWGLTLGGTAIALAYAGFGFAIVQAAKDLVAYSAYETISRGLLVYHSFTYFLSLVVLAPVVEEVYFRGALYAHVRRRVGWPVAVLLTATLFAFMHSPARPSVLAAHLFSGMVLALLREWRGSLLPSILMHAGLNLWVAAPTLWFVWGARRLLDS